MSSPSRDGDDIMTPLRRWHVIKYDLIKFKLDILYDEQRMNSSDYRDFNIINTIHFDSHFIVIL